MISLIVAFDEQQLIGVNNEMPWHFKEDLQYFKVVTSNHDLLMGRKTFESILSFGQKPLPNRHHYVLSRDFAYDHESVTVINDFKSFMKNYPSHKELFVIGGATIYEQALPFADKLYITHIEGSYVGDTYFPSFAYSDFQCVQQEIKGPLNFSMYERVK